MKEWLTWFPLCSAGQSGDRWRADSRGPALSSSLQTAPYRSPASPLRYLERGTGLTGAFSASFPQDSGVHRCPLMFIGVHWCPVVVQLWLKTFQHHSNQNSQVQVERPKTIKIIKHHQSFGCTAQQSWFDVWRTFWVTRPSEECLRLESSIRRCSNLPNLGEWPSISFRFVMRMRRKWQNCIIWEQAIVAMWARVQISIDFLCFCPDLQCWVQDMYMKKEMKSQAKLRYVNICIYLLYLHFIIHFYNVKLKGTNCKVEKSHFLWTSGRCKLDHESGPWPRPSLCLIYHKNMFVNSCMNSLSM